LSKHSHSNHSYSCNQKAPVSLTVIAATAATAATTVIYDRKILEKSTNCEFLKNLMLLLPKSLKKKQKKMKYLSFYISQN
jgi:hypothetical protein